MEKKANPPVVEKVPAQLEASPSAQAARRRLQWFGEELPPLLDESCLDELFSGGDDGGWGGYDGGFGGYDGGFGGDMSDIGSKVSSL